MNRGRNLIHSLTGDETINPELLPGVPIVEICDQQRVLVENHQGIIGYGNHEVSIKVKYGRLCVCGDNLRIKRMSKTKLVIVGNIRTVNLQGRG